MRSVMGNKIRVSLFGIAVLGWTLACNSGNGRTDEKADSGIDTETSADAGAPDSGEPDSDSGIDKPIQTIFSTCEEAEQSTTTVGCLFYAVDLDAEHLPDAEEQQYAVAVSNVHRDETASVTVHQGIDAGWEELDAAEVAPMDLHVFALPDNHQDSSGLKRHGAYKVVSTRPIVAYQFNPLDGANSWSSDASMLLPAHALFETHEIFGWKHFEKGRAYFTVVAVMDGTEVSVVPSVAPAAGEGVPGEATAFTVQMDEGDVLEVATKKVGQSMTGSHVTSNPGHPIAVFSGTECSNVPLNVTACDHLEEQLPGHRLWGRKFVAARMPVRSKEAMSENVLWQIYASDDDTEIALSSAAGVQGLPNSPATLNRGEMLELYVSGFQEAPGDFFIEASRPVGVMQYMVGASTDKSDGLGDPAMAYVSPVEQFLPYYVVLVPTSWKRHALIITRKEKTPVFLDDELIPDAEFAAVAESGYEVTRRRVLAGIHTLESGSGKDGLAVTVVGWDEYDSYAYTGGMGLQEINPDVR